MSGRELQLMCWGTYDTGKPRTRVLREGLRENGVRLSECHAPVWKGVEDKSQVKGAWNKAQLLDAGGAATQPCCARSGARLGRTWCW